MSDVPKLEEMCFVIGPIDEPRSDIRKRSDQLLRHIIGPAADTAGLKAIRSDQIEQTRLISHQVVECIIGAKLVVADLTGWNPNVFYELALRHSQHLPFVQLIQRDEELPFDVKDVSTVHYDLTDPDYVIESREKLGAHIKKAIDPDTPVETPFSVAANLVRMRESGDAKGIEYANLISEISSLRQDVREARDLMTRGEGMNPKTYTTLVSGTVPSFGNASVSVPLRFTSLSATLDPPSPKEADELGIMRRKRRKPGPARPE